MRTESGVSTNSDSELVCTFHDRVLPSLVYVESECLKTGDTSSGTGAVFGFQGNKKDGWLPLIVTAGHRRSQSLPDDTGLWYSPAASGPATQYGVQNDGHTTLQRNVFGI